MSSAASTEPRALAGFRPWQFFVLSGLISATIGVFLSHDTGPGRVILISLIILSASGVGIAVYRMLRPLVSGETAVDTTVGTRTRLALEREKLLALRAIKELEFDRAMGKVSDRDFEELVSRLRSRAVGLIRQLDSDATGYRDLIEQELARRLAASGAPATVAPTSFSSGPPAQGGRAQRVEALQCPKCATLNDLDARFCKACGGRLEE